MNPAGLSIGDIVGLQVSFKMLPVRRNGVMSNAPFKLIAVLRGVSLIDNQFTMVSEARQIHISE